MRHDSPTQARDKPEILAPAGGRAQLEAAVWSGADAVYFGLDAGLNARVRATSFGVDELPAIMDFVHERGVRGYLTLNTLVFDEELEQAEHLVRQAALAGVDALIVQDIGLTKLARELAPNLPIHGSTQMSITDSAGVRFAQQLGVKRVVLARELSVEEIGRISRDCGTEIEVFVHGALCVSYSGQCFSSEAWGGRSANRGQCAQACRLPYGLLVDGQLRETGDYRYLLSPQDLMAVPHIPRLIRAGVDCFKIEGRLKGPEYVLATVASYRRALDRAWDDLCRQRETDESELLLTTERRRLAQAFSRGQTVGSDGLTPGFLDGPRHQSLVIGLNPRHRGLLIGKVTAVTAEGVQVRLLGPVKRGDGLVFDRGRPEQREVGGNLHHVIDADGTSLTEETDRGEVELRFAADFRLAGVNPGDRIWRSRDSAGDKPARLDPRLAVRPVAVDVQIQASSGHPLLLTLSDHQGHRVSARTRLDLQAAKGAPLDAEKIRKAIGTLGDTPFRIDDFSCDIDACATPLFLPLGEIKTARREAVDEMLSMRRRHSRAVGLAEVDIRSQAIAARPARATVEAPKLGLLCRTRMQVEAALSIDGIQELVLDFLEVHGLKDACLQVQAAGRRLVVAAPRIFKPGEERLWRYYCRLEPDALLVRSAGLLWSLQRLGGSGTLLDDGKTRIPPLHGDFSLNSANLISARYLLEIGLERLALSHDLNGVQIEALVHSLPAAQRDCIEIIAHHHMPIFHTEYCVFARFLSDGNNYRDCGRPCEQHIVHLRDPGGGDHLVQADIGCRNTVFNAAAQSAGPLLGNFLNAGIRHYRVELVDEPGHEVAGIVDSYRLALAGQLSPQTLRQRLGTVTDANNRPQGVGLGSLAVRVEPPREQMKKPTAR